MPRPIVFWTHCRVARPTGADRPSQPVGGRLRIQRCSNLAYDLLNMPVTRRKRFGRRISNYLRRFEPLATSRSASKCPRAGQSAGATWRSSRSRYWLADASFWWTGPACTTGSPWLWLSGWAPYCSSRSRGTHVAGSDRPPATGSRLDRSHIAVGFARRSQSVPRTRRSLPDCARMANVEESKDCADSWDSPIARGVEARPAARRPHRCGETRLPTGRPSERSIRPGQSQLLPGSRRVSEY